MVKERKRQRSDSYQYLMHEISIPDHYVSKISDDMKNHAAYISEEERQKIEYIQELDDNLGEVFHVFLERTLTAHQLRIYSLCAGGMTQEEISKYLSCNQSSVQKSLNGNYCHTSKKKYGGIAKKINNAIVKDNVILTLMKEIYLILNEEWNVHLKWYHSLIRSCGGAYVFIKIMESFPDNVPII